MKVKDLVINQQVDIFLRIESIEEKVASNNKKYLQYNLTDGKDIVVGKQWDASLETLEKEVKQGTLVKCNVLVGEWQGKTQLTVKMIRKTSAIDGVDIEDFVRSAPLPLEHMQEEIRTMIDNMKNNTIKKIVSHIYEEYAEELLYYPAAKGVHHNIRGGWSFHILKMCEVAKNIAKVYPDDINEDLLVAGVILHDIEKRNELLVDEYGTCTDYTKLGKLKGHLVMGAERVAMAVKELRLRSDEALEIEVALQHLILSHHGKPEFGAAQTPKFLEAEILHLVDMVDSRVYMYRESTEEIEAGTFANKNFFLGNIEPYKVNL